MKKLVTIAFFLVLALINSQAQSCFTKDWSGSGVDHMNFYITKATVNGLNLQATDEIGIFDGSDCVGVGVLTQQLTGGAYLSIVASKDDPDTPAKDGFTANNAISYKLCSNGATVVITNVVANYTSGTGVFSIGGTVVVELTGTATVPNAPAVGTITQPTCALPTGSVVLSGLPATGTWTLTRTPGGTTTTGTGTSTTITGLAAGTYTYTVTNSSGFTSPSSANIVINAVPNAPAAPTVGTITQPTCSVATGSVVLNGLPSTGTWTLTRTPGNVTTSGTGTSTTITGLAAGTYTYTVTDASGCTSASSSNVVINAQPATPTAPVPGTITQPTCSVATGSVVLSGLPATGTWTLTRTPGSVTTSGTGTSTTITGLAAGTYTFTVTNASGCTSTSTGNIVINTQPVTPTAPAVGTITQPTCTVPTGSVVLSGLPSTGTWTLTRTPAGPTTTGTGTSTTITGLAAGTYTYTVTNASGCTSSSSSNIVINPVPNAPSAPTVGTITQPTCSVATGSVVLNGLPATGTWTLTRTPGGTTTTGTGTSTTISGLAAGTYTYTVTDASGCTSASSSNVVINVQPATPTAPVPGTITQPTCSVATGSVVLSGLPATGTWTLTRTPGSVTTSGTGINTTITGLAAGTYTYTVTNASGCTSPSTGNIVINTQPVTPTAPAVGTITQPTCTVPTGSVVLSGLPATGTWTLTRTPGGTTTTGTGTSTTITGLAAGTYTYTVTNASGCTSSSSSNIVINPVPNAPSAPTVGTITQPTCSVATGSVVLSGLPATGTWTLTRTPGNVTTTGTGISTTISGLAAGTYTYTVTDATGCISPSSSNVVINVQPATPTAPVPGTITQPTCSDATGSVVLSGLPATGTWTLTRTPGSVTSTGTGTSTTITGLAAGTYTYTVTNASGCTSPSTGNIVINTQPVTPTAPAVGTITQPTCAVPTGSVVLSGLPATGTWTLTRTPAGTTTTGTGTSTTITGLVVGTYTYTVTNASGCMSPSSENIVINAVPNAPSAPTVGTITQPTCSVATGSVVLSGLPATGTWTLTRTPGNVTTTGTGISTTISGLAAGTYTYSVTDATGCTSPSSANIVINAQPSTPTAPVPGTITQPTCSVATGSVVLNGLPATGTWTLTRTPGSVTSTGTGTSTTITGLAAGTYTYTVTNASGCTSTSTGNIVINTQPVTPTAPAVGTITQPTCAVPTGSVVLSGLPATGTWTLTRTPAGPTTTGTGISTTITGLAAGTYTYTVTNASGCTSSSSSNIVINAVPNAPSAPTVGTITQPTCSVATGSVVLNGLPATGTWTLTRTPGNVTTTGTGISSTITGLAAGTYTYTVTDATGCTSPSSGNIVILAQPTTPTAPVVGAITQPTCSVATGSVVLSGLPATGTWTLTRTPGSVTGTGTGTSTTITGLAAGTYTYTVTNASGCTSPSSANVVINAVPLTSTVATSSNPPAGGTTSGGGTYNCGASATVIAAPAAGYLFVNWTEGGNQVSTTASYTFTVTANRTLVANFVLTYSITTSSNPPAGGTTSGGGTYNSGASATVIAAPATGYQFEKWTEGGNQVSTAPSYTFVVTANRALVANFIPVTGQCFNETFTAATGTVTDNSGALDYQNNMSCEKLIQPAGGGAITLTFTSFSTEAWYDFVRVYDGTTTSAPLLGTFSGNTLPPVLTANSGSMLIRFTSDGSVAAAGWSANYSSGVPTERITVTSPNGGEVWQVGSSQNITWTSSGTSGTVKIEYSTNNGTSWTTILASTPDDGSQSWTVPNTPSTTCLVRVSDTDGSPVDISNAVFSITSVTGCVNETFTAASGTVTDNSGALDYQNNMSCEKLIQPSGGGAITLTFTSFSTEAWYDFVRVYNGTTTSAPLLGTFSGNTLPPVLTANSGSMLIRFTSDGSVTAAGWSANYTSGVPTDNIIVTAPNGGEVWQVGTSHNITWTSFGTSGTVKIEYSTNNGSGWTTILASTPDDGSQSWTVPNTPSTTCLVRVSDTDGSPVDISNAVFSIVPTDGVCINETFTAASGTVTDNSGALDYQNNMSCEKLIQPSGGGAITLTFTSFSTEAWYDFVRVYNGTTTSAPLLGTFSGNTLPPVLTANSGSMLIRFTSDGSVTAAGWSANYTSGVPSENITVTSPNGGEAWQVGSSQNITWTSSGTSGTVKIEYSTNNGSGWTTILASTPDDGSQSWTVPNTPSTTCLVRVSDTDGSPVDISNAVFSITPSSGGACINETFTAPSGTITDNSGASDYQNNMSCDKLIQISGFGMITLTFTAFNTEAWYDIVRVYAGSTTSAPLIGTFSGSSLPPVLTSGAGSMLIRFTTDGSVVAAGWSANYTTILVPAGAASFEIPGEVKNSKQITRETVIPDNPIIAYPNPTSGIITIESCFTDEEIFTLNLINSSGQIILNQTKKVIGGKFDVDLSEVSNGIYTLMIKTEKTVKYLRIIKN